MSDDKPEVQEPAPPAPAGEEMAALREKAAKADEYLDLARRAKAEFINYQDRVRRERQDWTRQAVEGFLRDFLPALDSFSMARFDDPKLTEAIRLIEKEFLRVLAKNGVSPIETAGRTFDPLYHEAVGVEEAPGKPDGAILDEVRRGWLVEGRVMRPASVLIAKGASAPPTPM
jgi:molecular chaperone GrpE